MVFASSILLREGSRMIRSTLLRGRRELGLR
jgi:hypothetical protein